MVGRGVLANRVGIVVLLLAAVSAGCGTKDKTVSPTPDPVKVGGTFSMDGNSMDPTILAGQTFTVRKFAAEPRGQDVVLLRMPRRPELLLVKRIVGVPGDTIEIIDGKIYVNAILLDEPYITSAWHDNKPKILVPPGAYFVMGDNRDNSLDSRSQQVGYVPEGLIIGAVVLR